MLNNLREWKRAEEREDYLENLVEYVDHQPVLISYNKKYEPKVVSPHVVFQIEGRVLN